VSGYPSHWESDVVLADGGTLHVRPIRPDDGDRMVAFHGRQSSESIYFRFFSPHPTLSPRELERLTVVDYEDRMVFVGLLDDELLGVALYDRWSGRNEAEVAVMVDDAEQGRGIGTVLLEFLAAAGRDAGFLRFTAQVLPSNRKMLGVFKQAGFDATSQFADGVIEVTLGIEPTPAARAAIEERAHRAEARSVARLLTPGSVAVIGAGRHRGVGRVIVEHLVAAGYRGDVHPVNPNAVTVAGRAGHSSVLEISEGVDQAVIAVPAASVPAVVVECARARVQSLIIVSAGFSERGPEGAAAEREVIGLARRYGMRVVGPNCLGILNTDPEVRLHASITPVHPEPGPVGLACQSGALGTAILEHADQVGLGVSTFVEAGNKADVSANDLLQYWEDDDRTHVVLLHLESFGNPRRFSRIARRVARSKPIVAVKGGEVIAGSGDVTLDALLRQVGVIRVDSIETLFDVARVLVHQPLPDGRRVSIVTNAAGPALLAADACQGAGLDLAGPPLDLGPEAGAAEYRRAVATAAADDEADAVLAVYAPAIAHGAEEVAAAIVSAQADKPVVATLVGTGPGELGDADGAQRRVPSFTFPERAARALAATAAYGMWCSQPAGEYPEFAVADEDAQGLVGGVLARYPDGRWLDLEDADALLGAYGLTPAGRRLVDGADEAVEVARAVGYPVTLKATGLERLGKSEAGGVALDLHGAAEVRRAYDRMVDALGDVMRPALVQAMVTPGVDFVVELTQHDSVGAILRLGVGGAVAASLPPLAVRVVPLTDLDAVRVVEEEAVADLLSGLSGPACREGLVETLLRLSQLADDLPEVAEIRANPVIVSAAGAALTDVAIRVAPVRREDRADLRRL
jgi:acyl-CoA synthetase (NDP forming)/GNAT superfamily N-acetyltransferase